MGASNAAGAALFAGVGGTLLIGGLGCVLALPFLIRLRKMIPRIGVVAPHQYVRGFMAATCS